MLKRLETPGVIATLLVGAAVLLGGLGSSGLWEPWEMNRADLARTLVEKPEVAAALGDDPALADALRSAASDAGVALRLSDPPTSEDRGVAAGAQQVRDALDLSRTRVVSAIVLDLDLLLGDTPGPAAWRRAWDRVEEAQHQVPVGRVVLVDGAAGGSLSAEAVHRGLVGGRIRAAWLEVRQDAGQEQLTLPADDDPAFAPVLDAAVADADPAARHYVFVPAAGVPELTAALNDAVALGRGVVRFKDDGETLAAPPLQPWLTALAYRAFGVTEFATRLPGALMALLVLALVLLLVRTLWGAPEAVLSGLVLVSTPLFYAQARTASGEPGAMLGLTLVAGGLALHGGGRAMRTVWAWLAAGAVVLLLSKGLFGLFLAAAIAGAGAIIVGRVGLRDLAPALALGVVLGLAALWVLQSPADSFAGQFRFTLKLFSDGPDVYHRNFDLIVAQIGFGAFPWSPLYLLAIGSLLFGLVERRDVSALVVVLWFAVPVLAVMGFLKSMNHFLWPGAPAGAVAVGLFLARVARRELSNRALAFVLVVMAFILSRELGKSAQPLADFLTLDPPFAREGSGRFPDTALASGLSLALLGVALLSAFLWRFTDSLRWAVSTFSRPFPAGVVAGLLLAVLPATWLGRVLSSYRVGMRLDTAAALSDGQRAFANHFLASIDPMVLLAYGAAATGYLLWLARAASVRSWQRWLLLIPLTGPLAFVLTPRVGAGLQRLLVGAAGLLGRVIPERLAPLVGAVAWALVGLTMVFSVGWPAGYWGETLGHPAMVAVLGAAGLLAVVVWRLGGDRRAIVSAVVGVLGLWLGTRLGRDADLRTWYAATLTLLGAVAWARFLLPRLWVSDARVAFGGGALLGLAGAALALPLLDRWDRMAPLLYPDAAESLIRYLMFKSRVTALAAAGLVGVAAAAWLTPLAHRVVGWVALVERGKYAVAGLVAIALVFTGLTVTGFYPAVSENVSQKHILDTWREAEQLSAEAPPTNLFRHGSFAGRGHQDVNFYTAGIPEIRDRAAALRALLGTRDVATSLETPDGTRPVLLPGWDAANDRNGDGRRDSPAVGGVATEVGPGRLIDAAAAWTPGAFKGQILTDADGRHWPITDNTATAVTFAGADRPAFAAGQPQRSHYTIAAPDSLEPQATADAKARRWFLLPAERFSEINHAFRQLSGGEHISIIDGRSYRVLLASSWLADGETQQNRYATHTLSREAFDALAESDPRVHRAWANFDDKIRVLGYRMAEEVVSRGKHFELTLYFESLAPVTKSYKIFLHVDRPGTSNRIHGDHWPLNLTNGGEDDKACTGCYRTEHWLKGDVAVDVYSQEVPIGTPSGPQDIWMGLYEPAGDSRLPVKNWDRDRVRHDGQNRVRLGSFQVR